MKSSITPDDFGDYSSHRMTSEMIPHHVVLIHEGSMWMILKTYVSLAVHSKRYETRQKHTVGDCNVLLFVRYTVLRNTHVLAALLSGSRRTVTSDDLDSRQRDQHHAQTCSFGMNANWVILKTCVSLALHSKRYETRLK